MRAPVCCALIIVDAISWYASAHGITALLQRDMRFGPVCAIGAAEAGTAAAVSIVLAALGFDAACLAWGVLAGALVAAVQAVIVAGRSGQTAPSLRGWRGTFRSG